MNLTISAKGEQLLKKEKAQQKQRNSGMRVTLISNNVLKRQNSNNKLSKIPLITSIEHYQHEQHRQQEESILNCCKQRIKQRMDTETDMPKKYMSPIKISHLNEQIIYLPYDFTLLKTHESSAKECNGSMWNIDSPVNRLY